MKVSYYPGCSLHSTGVEYGESTKDVCQKLGIELAEISDWNCCGAGSAHVVDEELAIELAARNLAIAEQAEMELIVPCAACFHRFKVAEKHIQNKKEPAVNTPYSGKIPIKHLLNFLAQEENLNAIKEKIVKPLSGLKPVCYYGCLIARPPKITDEVNYENPQAMDELLSSLGADVRPWSYKTDCCGGSLILARSDIVSTLTGKLIEKAVEAGANCIVTACPLCQANMDTKQAEISKTTGKDVKFPAFYFTELLALALGSEDVEFWMDQHIINPKELLKSQELL